MTLEQLFRMCSFFGHDLWTERRDNLSEATINIQGMTSAKPTLLTKNHDSQSCLATIEFHLELSRRWKESCSGQWGIIETTVAPCVCMFCSTYEARQPVGTPLGPKRDEFREEVDLLTAPFSVSRISGQHARYRDHYSRNRK